MQRTAVPVFHLIPHTHWDREWYRSRAGFLARLVPMMDEALEVLEQDRTLRFLLDGQTALVRDYLGVRPEHRDRLSALATSGQLETGPWYVLADELIPSAESAIRNLQIGGRDSAATGGALRVLYSPDAFGHPASLPVLAAEFGLEGIALWRGHAGDQDFFAWRAPDGTLAPVYHLPSSGYEHGAALPSQVRALRPVWAELRKELVARAATRHVAVFIGADHHPLRADLPALRDAIAELEPGAEVRISRLDEYVAAARQETSQLTIVEGELRDGAGHTWVLQGVHGTRLPLKRLNAETELLLERHAEPLAALTLRTGGRDHRPLLERAWRSVLETQFHDTIAGTVHDDAAAAGRLSSARTLARSVAETALARLAAVSTGDVVTDADAGALVVWNPRTTEAGGVAIVEITRFLKDELVGPPGVRRPRVAREMPEGIALAGPEGAWPVQVLGRRTAVERIEHADHYPDADRVAVTRVAVLVPPLPGLGVAQARLKRLDAARALDEHATADARGIRNGHAELWPHADGSFTVRAASGVTLERAFRICAENDAGDCYTVSARGRAPLQLQRRCTWRVLARGPLVAALEGRIHGDDVSIRIQLELRHDEEFVRVRLDLDNRGDDRRLLVMVPGHGASVAVAGAPFGFERRTRPAPGQWHGEARAMTAPAQRYVAAAGPESGAAVFTAGHMEYELSAAGDLVLTLLRSVGQLSRADLPERPGHAAWPTPVPAAQCHGAHSWSLALWPCTASLAQDPEQLAHAWERACLAPVARWYRGRGAVSSADGAVELSGDGLVTSAIAPAMDGPGTVLRCVNLLDRESRGVWRLRPAATLAWRVRADETRLAPLAIAGNDVRFRAGPRELVTILVN